MIESEEGTQNVAYDSYALYDITTLHHCIALGDGAQANNDYQLTFVANGRQFSAIMTPDEHKIVDRVVRRAVEKKNLSVGLSALTATTTGN